MLLHEFLRKGFRPFKLRRFLIWPPNSQTFFLKKINNAVSQRVIWSNNGQIDFVTLGKPTKPRPVSRFYIATFYEFAVA